ncbi:hypothetical protein [Streptomyces clavuligerus]|uniref:Uncharacterized protein n=1 Tax=Streptomyces clavuligerus TaxID=1901 RepID=B5H3Z3_STRCL|nr:hypothetical protein [Streptomyces clavuligerus]ANW16869.1 hypothetical protein BB341_00815 [Streptomyces clavuligerus]AXU11397.1 hypothetical protein D1794_00880 [Streptomyces clavuligerus]EDY53289.1 hypothetical protein SSCG_06317 [Streptomyces clavuligerus]EFG10612.1 Hypothetical protein SCLAV_5545 [Streptomyces clavuligerus]MBY6301212.1 hypothetical protein [Streptomyces clavuligerus]
MPSGNISIDYAEIVRVAGVMNQAVNDINPHLLTTKTTVEGLLDNGLFMQQSSPAMKAAYEKLTLSLQQAVESINSFATQFTKIKESVEKMDAEIAASTNNPS